MIDGGVSALPIKILFAGEQAKFHGLKIMKPLQRWPRKFNCNEGDQYLLPVESLYGKFIGTEEWMS